MGDDTRTYFNARETGKLTEAVVGLRRDIGDVKDSMKDIHTKLDKQNEDINKIRMKVTKLATIVSLIVSGIFLVTKEVLAFLTK